MASWRRDAPAPSARSAVGSRRAPNSGSLRASTGSVLAAAPMARATSRAGRGFTRPIADRGRLERLARAARSQPPPAARITHAPSFAQAVARRRAAAGVWSIRRPPRPGRWMSSPSEAASTPTKRSCIMTPAPARTGSRANRPAPLFRTTSEEADGSHTGKRARSPPRHARCRPPRHDRRAREDRRPLANRALQRPVTQKQTVPAIARGSSRRPMPPATGEAAASSPWTSGTASPRPASRGVAHRPTLRSGEGGRGAAGPVARVRVRRRAALPSRAAVRGPLVDRGAQQT